MASEIKFKIRIHDTRGLRFYCIDCVQDGEVSWIDNGKGYENPKDTIARMTELVSLCQAAGQPASIDESVFEQAPAEPVVSPSPAELLADNQSVEPVLFVAADDPNAPAWWAGFCAVRDGVIPTGPAATETPERAATTLPVFRSMEVRVIHSELGGGMISTQASGSSYGLPVFLSDFAGAFSPQSIGFGYFHRDPNAEYSADQLAWIDELIIAENIAAPGTDKLYFHFGATFKTSNQLQAIQTHLAEQGRSFYRNA